MYHATSHKGSTPVSTANQKTAPTASRRAPTPPALQQRWLFVPYTAEASPDNPQAPQERFPSLHDPSQIQDVKMASAEDNKEAAAGLADSLIGGKETLVRMGAAVPGCFGLSTAPVDDNISKKGAYKRRLTGSTTDAVDPPTPPFQAPPQKQQSKEKEKAQLPVTLNHAKLKWKPPVIGKHQPSYSANVTITTGEPARFLIRDPSEVQHRTMYISPLSTATAGIGAAPAPEGFMGPTRANAATSLDDVLLEPSLSSAALDPAAIAAAASSQKAGKRNRLPYKSRKHLRPSSNGIFPTILPKKSRKARKHKKWEDARDLAVEDGRRQTPEPATPVKATRVPIYELPEVEVEPELEANASEAGATRGLIKSLRSPARAMHPSTRENGGEGNIARKQPTSPTASRRSVSTIRRPRTVSQAKHNTGNREDAPDWNMSNRTRDDKPVLGPANAPQPAQPQSSAGMTGAVRCAASASRSLSGALKMQTPLPGSRMRQGARSVDPVDEVMDDVSGELKISNEQQQMEDGYRGKASTGVLSSSTVQKSAATQLGTKAQAQACAATAGTDARTLGAPKRLEASDPTRTGHVDSSSSTVQASPFHSTAISSSLVAKPIPNEDFPSGSPHLALPPSSREPRRQLSQPPEHCPQPFPENTRTLPSASVVTGAAAKVPMQRDSNPSVGEVSSFSALEDCRVPSPVSPTRKVPHKNVDASVLPPPDSETHSNGSRAQSPPLKAQDHGRPMSASSRRRLGSHSPHPPLATQQLGSLTQPPPQYYWRPSSQPPASACVPTKESNVPMMEALLMVCEEEYRRMKDSRTLQTELPLRIGEQDGAVEAREKKIGSPPLALTGPNDDEGQTNGAMQSPSRRSPESALTPPRRSRVLQSDSPKDLRLRSAKCPSGVGREAENGSWHHQSTHESCPCQLPGLSASSPPPLPPLPICFLSNPPNPQDWTCHRNGKDKRTSGRRLPRELPPEVEHELRMRLEFEWELSARRYEHERMVRLAALMADSSDEGPSQAPCHLDSGRAPSRSEPPALGCGYIKDINRCKSESVDKREPKHVIHGEQDTATSRISMRSITPATTIATAATPSPTAPPPAARS